MAKNRVITVQGIPVTVSYEDIDDYICITDIAAAKSDIRELRMLFEIG